MPLVKTAVKPGPNPASAGSTSPGDHMDDSTMIIKRTKTPSPGKTNESVKSIKPAKDYATRSYACVTASTPPRTAESAGPPHPPPTRKQVVRIRSLDGSRCFIHPVKVSRAVCGSIFAKKYIEQTLAITAGERGIKFEVANLDHLEQAPESVTRLGEWPVKCWVLLTMTLPMTLVEFILFPLT
ncbi:hypothetical protein E2C01_068420 [Portunus trituberculatus]|uniref:Uncharacterized protein n=1 Tax=Portunus trituberculatus TaxID=210409 RepID=A0A5B7HW44_PORTR|nr:hypothetical protein [Portunus trituberculatus]